MNMDLHLARVQQRWSEAAEEIGGDERLDPESLATTSAPCRCCRPT